VAAAARRKWHWLLLLLLSRRRRKKKESDPPRANVQGAGQIDVDAVAVVVPDCPFCECRVGTAQQPHPQPTARDNTMQQQRVSENNKN
jgi:hypothetical protein